ncbi:MAG: peptide deformylase [Verrucomicrobia bacterium Tous-C9LFEB]|nr:MAG: peptide deformylase [Verrucomicrobia bacterium Tous-C9LFEB]
MILEVVMYDHPVLRQKGTKIREITKEIRKLAADMLETMRAHNGVGLAAQQIGQVLQFAVIDVTGIKERESRMWVDGKSVNPEDYMPVLLINPVISGTKSKVTEGEGCLSFPGVYAEIPRSQRVKVSTQTLDGKTFEFEAGGLLGRAVQHEYDHLQGKLFIDLMNSEARKANREALELLRQGITPPSADEKKSLPQT